MCESMAHGTNWPLFLKFFTSWVATIFVTGLLSAAFFAQGQYAINKCRRCVVLEPGGIGLLIKQRVFNISVLFALLLNVG